MYLFTSSNGVAVGVTSAPGGERGNVRLILSGFVKPDSGVLDVILSTDQSNELARVLNVAAAE